MLPESELLGDSNYFDLSSDSDFTVDVHYCSERPSEQVGACRESFAMVVGSDANVGSRETCDAVICSHCDNAIISRRSSQHDSVDDDSSKAKVFLQSPHYIDVSEGKRLSPKGCKLKKSGQMPVKNHSRIQSALEHNPFVSEHKERARRRQKAGYNMLGGCDASKPSGGNDKLVAAIKKDVPACLALNREKLNRGAPQRFVRSSTLGVPMNRSPLSQSLVSRQSSAKTGDQRCGLTHKYIFKRSVTHSDLRTSFSGANHTVSRIGAPVEKLQKYHSTPHSVDAATRSRGNGRRGIFSTQVTSPTTAAVASTFMATCGPCKSSVGGSLRQLRRDSLGKSCVGAPANACASVVKKAGCMRRSPALAYVCASKDVGSLPTPCGRTIPGEHLSQAIQSKPTAATTMPMSPAAPAPVPSHETTEQCTPAAVASSVEAHAAQEEGNTFADLGTSQADPRPTVASRFERSDPALAGYIDLAVEEASRKEGCSVVKIRPLPLSVLELSRPKWETTMAACMMAQKSSWVAADRRRKIVVRPNVSCIKGSVGKGSSRGTRKPQSTLGSKKQTLKAQQLRKEQQVQRNDQGAQTAAATSKHKRRRLARMKTVRSISKRPLGCLRSCSASKRSEVRENEPIYCCEGGGQECASTARGTGGRHDESPWNEGMPATEAWGAAHDTLRDRPVDLEWWQTATQREPIAVSPRAGSISGRVVDRLDNTPYGNEEKENVEVARDLALKKKVCFDRLSDVQQSGPPSGQCRLAPSSGEPINGCRNNYGSKPVGDRVPQPQAAPHIKEQSQKIKSRSRGRFQLTLNDAGYETYAEIPYLGRTSLRDLSSHGLAVSLSTLTTLSTLTRKSIRAHSTSVLDSIPKGLTMGRDGGFDTCENVMSSCPSAVRSPHTRVQLLAASTGVTPPSPDVGKLQARRLLGSFSTQCSFHSSGEGSPSPEPVNDGLLTQETPPMKVELEKHKQRRKKATVPVLDFCRTHESERMMRSDTPVGKCTGPKARRQLLPTSSTPQRGTGISRLSSSTAHTAERARPKINVGRAWGVTVNSDTASQAQPAANDKLSSACSYSSTSARPKSRGSAGSGRVSGASANVVGQRPAEGAGHSERALRPFPVMAPNALRSVPLIGTRPFSQTQTHPTLPCTETLLRARKRAWSVGRLASGKPGSFSYFCGVSNAKVGGRRGNVSGSYCGVMPTGATLSHCHTLSGKTNNGYGHHGNNHNHKSKGKGCATREKGCSLRKPNGGAAKLSNGHSVNIP